MGEILGLFIDISIIEHLDARAMRSINGTVIKRLAVPVLLLKLNCSTLNVRFVKYITTRQSFNRYSNF